MAKELYREASKFVTCTTSGSTYTLYTCPANCRARIPIAFITNAGSNSATIIFRVYKNDVVTSFPLIGGKTLAANDYIHISDPTGIILESGDRIEVVATGTTPNVTASCTSIETFRPVG
jgi:hypothetical protein